MPANAIGRLSRLLLLSVVATTQIALAKQTISGSDSATITISRSDTELMIEHEAPGANADRTLFLAIGSHQEIGSAVIPFAEKEEGSTVFLPFKADRLFAFKISGNGSEVFRLDWQKWKWNERQPISDGVSARVDSNRATLRVPVALLGPAKSIDLAVYTKEFASNSWGRFFACNDRAVTSGNGDKYIPSYLEIKSNSASREHR